MKTINRPIRNAFVKLVCELGELRFGKHLSKSVVKVRLRNILMQWACLEYMAGRRVSRIEANKWGIKNLEIAIFGK